MRFLICGILSPIFVTFLVMPPTAHAQVVIGSPGLVPTAQLTIDNSVSNANAKDEIVQLLGVPAAVETDQVLLMDGNGYLGSVASGTLLSRDSEGRFVTPTDEPLLMGSLGENSDPIFFRREQNSTNQTDLFLAIGDDHNILSGAQENFVIGTVDGPSSLVRDFKGFVFSSGGKLTMNAYGKGNSVLAGNSGTDYVLMTQPDGTVRELPASDFSYSSSDQSLKTEIKPLEGALEKLLQLEGVSYAWVDQQRGSGRQIGFIAQDVEATFPEVVRTDHNGIKSVGYGFLTAAIVEALRETNARLDVLEAENAALKAELDALGSASN